MRVRADLRMFKFLCELRSGALIGLASAVGSLPWIFWRGLGEMKRSSLIAWLTWINGAMFVVLAIFTLLAAMGDFDRYVRRRRRIAKLTAKS